LSHLKIIRDLLIWIMLWSLAAAVVHRESQTLMSAAAVAQVVIEQELWF
jgi:hypothetical protein